MAGSTEGEVEQPAFAAPARARSTLAENAASASGGTLARRRAACVKPLCAGQTSTPFRNGSGKPPARRQSLGDGGSGQGRAAAAKVPAAHARSRPAEIPRGDVLRA